MTDLIVGLILYIVDSALGFLRRSLRFVLHPVASIHSRGNRFVALADRAWASDLGLSTQLAAAIQRSLPCSRANVSNASTPVASFNSPKVIAN